MNNPEPTWLRNQNLAIIIFESVKPRVAKTTVEWNCDGLIRAVAREAIFLGYRNTVKPTRKKVARMKLFNQLSKLITPRISVYMRTHHQDTLDIILHELIYLGYRLVPGTKTTEAK